MPCQPLGWVSYFLIQDNNWYFDVFHSLLSVINSAKKICTNLFDLFEHYSDIIPSISCDYTYCIFFSILFFLCAYTQMLSVSQAAGSPAVSLVYTVRNGTVFLNGTTASNLLGQLSAELVGYFLFYPPLVIAERKSHFALRNPSLCQQ